MIKTSATKKIFALRKRIRGVYGGTGASKTISILLWLIKRCQTNPNELWSVTTDFFPRLQKGAIRDFMNIMEEHKYFQPDRWHKTDHIYTFETKSQLEFFSADQSAKVRGPRRTGIFINEANTISLETFRQLDVRSEKVIWLDWNPVQEFWWYSDVVPNFDVDSLVLTYKDNEGLSPQQVQSIEGYRFNKSWWRVFGEGLLGEVEGKIYRDWQFIDEIPHEARLERRGLDFGYSNDESAIVDIYYYNGGYILDEITYQKGLSNKQLADIILNLPQVITIADSAEPKSIDEIKSYGVNILPVIKGHDSVVQGIQFVQDQRISVTKRSINIYKEYGNYLWETDKDGRILNKPIGIFNNAMDAIRYGFDGLRERVKPYIPPKNDISFKDFSFK